MNEQRSFTATDILKRVGPSRDFSSFSEMELERRNNSDTDFDLEVFHEAVILVLRKIAGLSAEE